MAPAAPLVARLDKRAIVTRAMGGTAYVEPPCKTARAVFKRRGRWYASVACPRCSAQLRVRLSLGPMVARCEACAEDVEADLGPLVANGRA